MKKIFIHLIYIIIALWNLGTPTMCAEKNWLQRKADELANKLQHKADNLAQSMLTRHSYTHLLSFAYLRDKALLHFMPSHCAQYVLQKQRGNMLNFLKKNEENALEDVRKSLNLDEKTWSDLMTTFEKEHALHLSEMKKENPSNAVHDKQLPPEWINDINHEAYRHNINPKRLNLGIIDDPTSKAYAHTYTERLCSGQYNHPVHINLNIEAINWINKSRKITTKTPLLDAIVYALLRRNLRHTATHEFTHIVQGHDLRQKIISNDLKKQTEELSKQLEELKNLEKALRKNIETIKIEQENLEKGWSVMIPYRLSNLEKKTEESRIAINIYEAQAKQLKEKSIKYQQSIEAYETASLTLTAAQEKTADTYIPCIDKQAARNTRLNTVGYLANCNDLRVIHANWQTDQAIENRDKFYRSLQKNMQQFTKEYMF